MTPSFVLSVLPGVVVRNTFLEFQDFDNEDVSLFRQLSEPAKPKPSYWQSDDYVGPQNKVMPLSAEGQMRRPAASPAGSTTVCPACGGSVEATFSNCQHCCQSLKDVDERGSLGRSLVSFQKHSSHMNTCSQQQNMGHCHSNSSPSDSSSTGHCASDEQDQSDAGSSFLSKLRTLPYQEAAWHDVEAAQWEMMRLVATTKAELDRSAKVMCL
mmetsp:Transcript_15138/g.32648  ORF Transcript_15138/g.32648 Transcript_15138/m.32648 type:complete len:212 (+) Transcript_15138:363-998(+)|eukprot:CAMPEP_0206420836 /NCGR_PEP_ID=MMETSP0324_2-20121206/1102_1 /ASSEMBLY_ACC=CAM_ASM_000836 /TAXON_ID=2866 /ORGANISM="Crypthecodinium cohnii, Strain Seligo" /LENGTH=211 /DNA_ID=CAMNT_0053884841 /DNA_START=292 /DNA_END=927 /DNA_ORIENTATION=-